MTFDTRDATRADGLLPGDEFVLTEPSLFELDYIAVPPDISELATTFYHFRCDEPVIRDIQPAAVGHLTLFPKGEGAMLFRDGSRDPSHRINLLTPFSIAAPFEVDGPFHAVGIALSPQGWAALTGMCAGEHGNRLLDAREHLHASIGPLAEELVEGYNSGELTGHDVLEALADFLRTHARPINPRHADLIATVNTWLSGALEPELDDLYARLAYSRRQAQRLVERYFGLPPQALRRKYKALRTAAFMSLPNLAPEFEEQVTDAYYDQSHMIREIQLFAGRTPARLSGGDTPFLNEMLDLKNLREIGFDPARARS